MFNLFKKIAKNHSPSMTTERRSVVHRTRFNLDNIAELREELAANSKDLANNSKEFMQEISDLVDKLRQMQRDTSVFGGLYSTLPDAAIRVSENNTIINMNRSAETMFNGNVVQGMAISQLIGIDLLKFLDGRGNITKEVILQLPNGVALDTSVSVTRVKHIGKNEGIEYVVVVRDISEIKRLREVLRENTARFDLMQTALDHSEHPILISDQDYKIIFANKRIADEFGYSIDTCIGKDICFLCDATPTQESIKIEAMKKLKNDEVWQGSLIVSDIYNNTMYVSSTIVPVDANDKRYYITIFQNYIQRTLTK